jgi:hypothetical protein
MKTCTYCGKVYEDSADVCAIDRQPLTSTGLTPAPPFKEEPKPPRPKPTLELVCPACGKLCPPAPEQCIHCGSFVPLPNVARIDLKFTKDFQQAQMARYLSHTKPRRCTCSGVLAPANLIRKYYVTISCGGHVVYLCGGCNRTVTIGTWGDIIACLVTGVAVLGLAAITWVEGGKSTHPTGGIAWFFFTVWLVAGLLAIRFSVRQMRDRRRYPKIK